MFCKVIFRKSNLTETKKYYEHTLEEKYLCISETDIKEYYH